MKKTDILKKTIILAIFGFLFSNISLAQINYLNIVKSDLKKKYKGSKIYEFKKDLVIEDLTINSEEADNKSFYKFSSAVVLKGNLMVKGKKSKIVLVDEESGGGPPSNIYKGRRMLFAISIISTGIYNVTEINVDLSNPPKNDDGCFFYAMFIKDGFLFGQLNVCKKRGMTRYDDIWVDYKAKCRIKNNRFELVN